MDIPITQSREWQNLQEALGEQSFLEKGEDFQYLAIRKTAKMANYLYLPYGPVFSNKNGFDSALKSLKKLASTKNISFIRIEPLIEEAVKFLPSNTVKSVDLNPKETWVLDLKGEEKELYDKFPSRLLRYYKNAQKKGIKIEKSHNPKDIKYLITLQSELAKEKGINTFSEKYLQTELAQPFSTLYYLKYKDQETGKESIIAAGLVFDDKTTRYNLQGAQSELGRKLHATGILTIQLIIDAKEKGLKNFDFWGIAPEGAPKNHPWAGFTNFKKTFKGKEVRYAGTYDIVLEPTRYRLYKTLRRLNRFIRRNS